MRFRDDAERAAVADAVCSRAPALRNLWTPAGPTERYLDLVRDAGGGSSSGERILLYISLAVWGRIDLWPESQGFTLEDLFYRLDSKSQRMLGELIVGDVDAWLSTYGQERAQ